MPRETREITSIDTASKRVNQASSGEELLPPSSDHFAIPPADYGRRKRLEMPRQAWAARRGNLPSILLWRLSRMWPGLPPTVLLQAISGVIGDMKGRGSRRRRWKIKRITAEPGNMSRAYDARLSGIELNQVSRSCSSRKKIAHIIILTRVLLRHGRYVSHEGIDESEGYSLLASMSRR